jgi:hypothetical protein
LYHRYYRLVDGEVRNEKKFKSALLSVKDSSNRSYSNMSSSFKAATAAAAAARLEMLLSGMTEDEIVFKQSHVFIS